MTPPVGNSATHEAVHFGPVLDVRGWWGPVLGTGVHKGLQFMGSWGAGGSKAGSRVQRGVPSGGRGRQTWEGFPGKEDGHSGEKVRVEVGLGSSLAYVPGQVPVPLWDLSGKLFKKAVTLQMGPFPHWLQAPGDLGSLFPKC